MELITWFFKSFLLKGIPLHGFSYWEKFFLLVQSCSVTGLERGSSDWFNPVLPGFFWLVHSCSITSAPFWGQFLKLVSCSFTWPPASHHWFVSLNFFMTDKGGFKAKASTDQGRTSQMVMVIRMGISLSLLAGIEPALQGRNKLTGLLCLLFDLSLSSLVKVYNTHTWCWSSAHFHYNTLFYSVHFIRSTSWSISSFAQNSISARVPSWPNI